MFARMGGDEFTILLPAVDCEEHVESIAQRIMHCVEQPWDVQGQLFEQQSVWGLRCIARMKPMQLNMMKEVDIALYQVKGKGRNHYQFYNDGLSA